MSFRRPQKLEIQSRPNGDIPIASVLIFTVVVVDIGGVCHHPPVMGLDVMAGVTIEPFHQVIHTRGLFNSLIPLAILFRPFLLHKSLLCPPVI
jgi:hypothetical protein